MILPNIAVVIVCNITVYVIEKFISSVLNQINPNI